MTGDGRRADVEGDAEGDVVQPRPDRGDRALVMDGDRHGAVPVHAPAAAPARTAKSTPSAGRSHSEAKRVLHPPEIAGHDSPSSASTSST